jgi:hypothetical protein
MKQKIYYKPLVEAIKKNQPEKLTEKVLEGDHSLSDKRVALARILLEWIE